MLWRLQENPLDKTCIDILVDFIKSNERFTQSSKVKEMEKCWSEWQGCKYSVFLNSGSSANLVLVSAVKELYQWKNGDEIIVPAVTWVTNISPIMQLGLHPVFIDINLNDLSFDYQMLEDKITDRTKAIFVTHLLGIPADMDKIKHIIGDRNIVLLEDCCEAHGATFNKIKVGNFGLGSTFSFYWGHHMTTVEGGMISTDNEDLYHLCLLKRSHGLARELPQKCHDEYKKKYPDIDFEFLFLTDGFNLRNIELNALLGILQIRSLNQNIEIRNSNFKNFINICSNYTKDLIIIDNEGISSLCLPFIFKDSDKKRRFKDILSANCIEARPLISGNLLRQPFLKHYINDGDFKNADFIHDNALYIGNNQFVNEERMLILEKLMQDFFKME